jgi:hypothetical protein
MTALTTPRDTKSRGSMPIPQEMEVGIKGGSKCIQGGMIVIDSSGYATPMTAAPGLICLGICDPFLVSGQTATSGAAPVAGIDDNTTGTNGQLKTKIKTGIRKMSPGAGADAPLITDIGNDCFGLDDNTVARTDKGGTLSRAGKIVDVDADGGVWVCFGMAIAGAATVPQTAALMADLGYHAPVRCVFPTNFAGTNVSGVLTATSNGALATQDGVAPAVGDRVLLAGQTTAADNGIYVVTSLGGASAKAVLTRGADALTGSTIINGESVNVSEGTIGSGTCWIARATGTGNLVGTNDPKFYPEALRFSVTLAAGTYTIGAGGGGEALFLFATATSVVACTRKTVGGTVTTTIMYGAPGASRIAGVAGTAAVNILAEVAAGTVQNTDTSVIDVLITN